MNDSQLNVLSECCIFKGIAAEELKKIAENYGYISAAEKNETIFSETNYSRSLVIILKGSATVTKCNGGVELLMSILNAGDIFGMAAMFYEEPGFLTQIKAREKVSMMFISKEDLKKIFAQYPLVCENYITVLSEKIHFLNNKINTYTKPEALGKVASFILQYAEKDAGISVLPYSVTKVAEALNAGRASVYRAFEALENEKIIKRQGKIIEILNYDALANL